MGNKSLEWIYWSSLFLLVTKVNQHLSIFSSQHKILFQIASLLWVLQDNSTTSLSQLENTLQFPAQFPLCYVLLWNGITLYHVLLLIKNGFKMVKEIYKLCLFFFFCNSILLVFFISTLASVEMLWRGNFCFQIVFWILFLNDIWQTHFKTLKLKYQKTNINISIINCSYV